jgi:hypothetical protein
VKGLTSTLCRPKLVLPAAAPDKTARTQPVVAPADQPAGVVAVPPGDGCGRRNHLQEVSPRHYGSIT